MHKKARLAIELGTRAVLFYMDGTGPKVEAVLKLEEFSINGSAVKWCMTDNFGHIIEGRIQDKNKLPKHLGSWVTLCIPMTIHYFGNVSPSFIFYIPSSRRILTEYQFKQEFPKTAL